MNMRIALCLSGQMRTYLECYESLCQHLLEPFAPDVFIHTWSNTGISHKERDSRGTDEAVTEDRLQALYTPVAVVIENFVPEYTDQIGPVKVPDILRTREPLHYRGSLPMFYKMFECNKLKSDYERDNAFVYDFVIRLRPDLALGERLPGNLFLDDKKLWQSDYMITHSFQVNDKFALGASHVMDYYTSVYNRLHDYWRHPLGVPQTEKNHRVGERLMKYHMDISGIEVETFSIDCDLVRIDRMNNHV